MSNPPVESDSTTGCRDDRERRVGWVDCASFAVMDELDLSRFLGFDDDFVRAGFTAYR
jgi:predicted nucleic acid-binding protein